LTDFDVFVTMLFPSYPNFLYCITPSFRVFLCFQGWIFTLKNVKIHPCDNFTAPMVCFAQVEPARPKRRKNDVRFF